MEAFLVMKKIIIALVMILSFTTAIADEHKNISADEAFSKLVQGNQRFYTSQMTHPNQSKERIEELIKAQHPYAVILACSDSRVAPEIIFDQGLGDLFVIRNAGDVLDQHVMGSIEYAVHHLGVNLIVVLGHESCGAVGAAMSKGKEPAEIESIKKEMVPAIKKCEAEKKYTYENVIKTHAKLDALDILKNKNTHEYAKKHDIKVISAYYNIETGKVEFLK